LFEQASRQRVLSTDFVEKPVDILRIGIASA
jgi:hypothetical protein